MGKLNHGKIRDQEDGERRKPGLPPKVYAGKKKRKTSVPAKKDPMQIDVERLRTLNEGTRTIRR